MDRKSCLLLLGLEETATSSDIKKAYYKLAKQYHPDKTQGDEFLKAMFVKINAAYEFLKNPTNSYSRAYRSHEGPRVDNEEDLMPAVDDYIARMERVRSMNKSKRVYSTKGESGVRLSNMLIGLVVFVVLLSFFYPDRLAGRKKMVDKSIVSDKVVKIYKRANNKSKVLLEVLPTEIRDTLGTTRYFYKVDMVKDGKKVIGYILKTKVLK